MKFLNSQSDMIQKQIKLFRKSRQFILSSMSEKLLINKRACSDKSDFETPTKQAKMTAQKTPISILYEISTKVRKFLLF